MRENFTTPNQAVPESHNTDILDLQQKKNTKKSKIALIIKQIISTPAAWIACGTGCFSIVLVSLVVIGAVLSGGLVNTKNPKTELPGDFPKEIIPYQLDMASSILVLQTDDSGAKSGLLNSFDLLIYSIISSGKQIPGRLAKPDKLLVLPRPGYKIVTIIWDGASLDRASVLSYYGKELPAKGFKLESWRDKAGSTDEGVAQKQDISINIFIKNSENSGSIDLMRLIIQYPSETGL